MSRSGSRILFWLNWLISGRKVPLPPPPPQLPPQIPSASGRLIDEENDEARLITYVRRIGILDERPARADAAELLALTRLAQSGNLAAATRLGGALASALPDDDALQLLVAELLVRQRLGEIAQPLLKRVVTAAASAAESPSAKRRARWLLAEIAAESGQTAAACAELTQLLADDFHYPGARERLRTLRHKLGHAAPHAAAAGGATLHAAMAAAPTLLGAGATSSTRYRLRQELGCGTSGTVYLADDDELGCAVALKLFHPQKLRAPKSSDAARREARLLSSLRHPGVLFLYELDPQGRFLTMELCEGGSLRTRLSANPLPLFIALRRAVELCDTLRAVHALSIAHGDVKPENLLFRAPARSLLEPTFDPPFGDLVLGDFGVGIDASREPQAPTAGAGTRAYLPPERLRGAPPSAAADLYAFGVVLEELCGLGPATSTLRALIEKLKSQDAAARPAAATALSTLRELLTTMEKR